MKLAQLQDKLAYFQKSQLVENEGHVISNGRLRVRGKFVKNTYRLLWTRRMNGIATKITELEQQIVTCKAAEARKAMQPRRFNQIYKMAKPTKAQDRALKQANHRNGTGKFQSMFAGFDSLVSGLPARHPNSKVE